MQIGAKTAFYGCPCGPQTAWGRVHRYGAEQRSVITDSVNVSASMSLACTAREHV